MAREKEEVWAAGRSGTVRTQSLGTGRHVVVVTVCVLVTVSILVTVSVLVLTVGTKTVLVGHAPPFTVVGVSVTAVAALCPPG